VFVFDPMAENGSGFTEHLVPQGLVSSAMPALLWTFSATTQLIYLTNLLSTDYQTPRTRVTAVSSQIGLFISNAVAPTAGVTNYAAPFTNII
jgi:hypothetical protein